MSVKIIDKGGSLQFPTNTLYCIYLQYLLKQMHIPADFFLFVCSYTICKTAYSHADLADLRRQKTVGVNESVKAENVENDICRRLDC